MKIVIDIKDDDYYDIIGDALIGELTTREIINAVKDGTPLPKSHGRLIDADKLDPDYDWSEYETDTGQLMVYGYQAYSTTQIESAPTIIEADTESEDKHTEERTKTHACDCKTHGRTHACDCISREAAFDEIVWNSDNGVIDAKVAIEALRNLPSVEPERKSGKWIENKWGEETCSECGYTHKVEGSNYCPNCGAKMEVE